MGNFKQQFNHAFQEAPTFSTKARQHVKSQLHQKKKKRWMPISIVTAAAVALVSFVIWNDELLGRLNDQSLVSLAAPEHEEKMEIFLEVKPDNETQFTIKNLMNSMNRGNGEYIGDLAVETKFDEIQYGQVLLLEDGQIDDAFSYVLGRVIGKPGDKVAIKEGQLYLNDLPIETFYGKSQIMGTTDVEEAFERLRKVNSTEWIETIEEALNDTLQPFTLKEGELFIVSDNWARNSVRKTFKIDQIEGVVLGYNDDQYGYQNWRKLTDEELTTIKALSEKIFTGIQNQDKEIFELVSSEYFSIPDPHNDIESILEINLKYLSDEVMDHYLSYYSYVYTGNAMISLKKSAGIAYKMTDTERAFYLNFVLENGEWKFSGYRYD